MDNIATGIIGSAEDGNATDIGNGTTDNITKFNILASTENLSHEEWLAYRNLGIGGSDASVVCGINKWKSPVELWMEKSDMIKLGSASDTGGFGDAGEPAYWGNRLEGLVKEEFTLRTGIEVIPVNEILQSEEHPFMLANLDGYCYHPEYGEVVFEAKTSSAYRSGEWVSSNSHDNGNGIPDEYILQLQHYMAVTGFKGAYIAVLLGGNTFKYQFVECDEELISMLIQLESEFWDKVQSGIPPELDGSDASAKLLNEHFPDSVAESVVTLPDDASYLIEQYNYAVHEIDRFTESKQEAENKLKQMLGDNEVGIVGESDNEKIIVSWKSFSQSRLDTKAIRADHPTLCSRYSKETTSRRFSIKTA